MEKKFLRNREHIISSSLLYFFIQLFSVIMLKYLELLKTLFFLPLIILVLGSVLFIFYRKELTKVVMFNNEGISFLDNGIQIKHANWADIQSVKRISLYRTRCIKIELENGKEMSFNVSRKVVNAMISCCSIEKIKKMLRKI